MQCLLIILMLQVARQAACYQAAMEQLVRLDIPKALPILAQYLTVMSDLIVHPDARWRGGDDVDCAINPEDFPVLTDAVDDYCDLHHVVLLEGIWIARKPTSNAYGWKTGDTRS